MISYHKIELESPDHQCSHPFIDINMKLLIDELQSHLTQFFLPKMFIIEVLYAW